MNGITIVDIGKILAILAMVWRVGVWVYKKIIINCISFFKSHNELIEKVNYVAAELKYNGGSSSKYQLRKITELAEGIKGKVDKISSKQSVHFELADAAMFECDSNGKCVAANASLCELFETTKEQMMGLGWLNYIEPFEESKERYLERIETDNEITDDYTIITARTRTKIEAKYTAQIKRDERGNIINIIGKVYILKT